MHAYVYVHICMCIGLAIYEIIFLVAFIFNTRNVCEVEAKLYSNTNAES